MTVNVIIGHKLLNFSSQVDITKEVCLPPCSYKKNIGTHALASHKNLKNGGRISQRALPVFNPLNGGDF